MIQKLLLDWTVVAIAGSPVFFPPRQSRNKNRQSSARRCQNYFDYFPSATTKHTTIKTTPSNPPSSIVPYFPPFSPRFSSKYPPGAENRLLAVG